MSRHVLFGTSSWGLGHATRDLVLLEALIRRGCTVSVVSTGPALRVLQGELGERCHYLDWPDIPCTLTTNPLLFCLKTAASIPRILEVWKSEQRLLGDFLSRQQVDLIISDHRYGLVVDQVPCYFISHSPRYLAPWRNSFMESVMEWYMAKALAPVAKLLIPDEEEAGGLSGVMSHNIRFFPRDKCVFLGILSSLQPQQAGPADGPVDYFISVSGPEPQRSRLQELALAQAPRLTGKVVIALGMPGHAAPPAVPGVEVHAYLDRQGQQQMMSRARLTVCRSGYTTIMELCELGRQALLIPTPGQTEQEYLARTLRQRGCFFSVEQDQLDLPSQVGIALKYPGYRPLRTTAQAVERFLATVLE